MRNFDGNIVTKVDIKELLNWNHSRGKESKEISYKPIRVLMQDFTGVPAIVDLAAMRDAVQKLGGDISKVNPIAPTHLVIDHSIQVDNYGTTDSLRQNIDLEMQRNIERYEFLKWGQNAFNNFKVVPPGTGICHQVNLEHIAQVVWERDGVVFPDTLVGTDSHTTMINALGVLGWGVGGIEAESVMLGQPMGLLIPEVIGFEFTGEMQEGITATDVVLTVTQILRKYGVVNKFVEFFGSGLSSLSLADRATIANMAPEYGATCGIFPIDEETINYLKLTGRPDETVALVEEYAKMQNMWRDERWNPDFTDTIHLDLSTVKTSVAGPKRPQDKVLLGSIKKEYHKYLLSDRKNIVFETEDLYARPFTIQDFDLMHGIHLDPNVSQFLGDVSEDESKEWLQRIIKHQDQFGFSQWAIFEKNTNNFVGKGGILVVEENFGRTPPAEDFIGKLELSVFVIEDFKNSGHDRKFIDAASNWLFENYRIAGVVLFSSPTDTHRLALYKSAGANFDRALDGVNSYILTRNFAIDEDTLKDGSVAIASITSCTNTSNPSVLIAAGLLAKKAVELGLASKKFVKTSLAPGSRVVEEYLKNAGLQPYLDKLGFNIVGFGCATCIGNSGPLKPEFESQVKEQNLAVASVLSGNRNFEGRVHPLVKMNFLASPPLVVAYALAGHLNINFETDFIGISKDGHKVYLKDIWPSNAEINKVINKIIDRTIYEQKYKNVFLGDSVWQSIQSPENSVYEWRKNSTYIENPPYFENSINNDKILQNISGARALMVLGDSITTDHISPAGNIAKQSPAANYLRNNNIPDSDFNSYGARRGSHSVMMRGTFANVRLKNEMLDGIEGGYTKNVVTGEQLSIYDAAMQYKKTGTPLLVFAGKEYGTGSSRDWAAKGTFLLGIKAVIAESFERIHRSNLIGMGVLPLEFTNSETRKSLNISGLETFDLIGIDSISVNSAIKLKITYLNGESIETTLLARVDTSIELEYLKAGGIMQYVTKQLMSEPVEIKKSFLSRLLGWM